MYTGKSIRYKVTLLVSYQSSFNCFLGHPWNASFVGDKFSTSLYWERDDFHFVDLQRSLIREGIFLSLSGNFEFAWYLIHALEILYDVFAFSAQNCWVIKLRVEANTYLLQEFFRMFLQFHRFRGNFLAKFSLPVGVVVMYLLQHFVVGEVYSWILGFRAGPHANNPDLRMLWVSFVASVTL